MPATPLRRSTGAELGARTALIHGLQSSLAAWMLDLQSELVWDGDAGGNTPSGPTRRYGVLNTSASDIDYYYVSRLPGEIQAGVGDIHTHRAEPRSIRIGVRLKSRPSTSPLSNARSSRSWCGGRPSGLLEPT